MTPSARSRTTESPSSVTAGTVATADSLAELDERLDEVSGLIGSYIERTEDATELVDHQRQVLDTSARRARLAIVAFGLVFGLSQFVPLYLGLTLMRGAVEIRDP